MIIHRSVGTHSGTFHADEVTACALLLVYDLIDPDKIIRTRDIEKLSTCEFVCDVGGEYDPLKKRFDHHQVSYKGDFSSAGMIWLYLSKQNIVSKTVYYFLNHLLIQGVDAHDNGRVTFEPGVCTFSHIISNFVPIHYDASSLEQDEAFQRALDFVVGHLRRALDRFTYVLECRDAVKIAMAENKDYLYFSKALPWLDAFFELRGEDHPAKFVIMPSGGSWKLRGIPPSTADRMKVRRPLPESWGGLLDKDLQEATKIPGAIFCHKGLFISVWETEEDAFKAMEYAIAERSVK